MTLNCIALLAVLMSSWQPLGSATPMSINKYCDTNFTLALTNVTVYENGSVWDHEGEILYPPGTHWSNPGEEDVHIVCPCNITERPCLRKCCPMGQGMTMELKCSDHEHHFKFEVKEDNDSKTVEGRKHFALLYGNPCQRGRFYLEPDLYPDDEFWIRHSDGVLVTPSYDMSEYSPNSFCLDYFPEKGLHLPAICVAEDMLTEEEEDNLAFKIYPIFMIISSIFLLATFLVYALIPELRNLHGMCLMSHVGSLAVTYIFLAIVQIGGKNISDDFCKASAYIIEFAFLATFFWLNSMCFDICITFCMRPLPGSLKDIEIKKFIMYSAYSWGVPAFILVISIIMDFAPGIPDTYLKPRFGRSRCWFDRKIDAFAYFYGPVAVLIVCNIIMFIITAVKIRQLNKQTDIVKKAGSRDDKENKNRFNLYLKLLIVMGVNWIMEVVSWAVGGPDYLWYITDIGNTLQGIFIFVIFVCKNKIRKVVMKKMFARMSDGTHSSFVSNMWRSARGSSPAKSSSGQTASSAFVSQSDGNIKMKGVASRSRGKIYEEE